MFLDVPSSKIDSCKHFDKETSECIDEFVPVDFDCLRKFNQEFEESCGRHSDQSRKYVKYFVRECEHSEGEIEQALERLRKACDI